MPRLRRKVESVCSHSNILLMLRLYTLTMRCRFAIAAVASLHTTALAVDTPFSPGLLSVDCEAEVSCSGFAPCCMVRNGPPDQSPESYAQWKPEYESWRARVRSALEGAAPRGFEAYDEPAVEWSTRDWVQAKTMLHDRFLFDRESNSWTPEKYLEDLRVRYGGVDSVVLWQFYPNGGVDNRNQFDMIESLPGGIAAVRRLVEHFEAAGVKSSGLCSLGIKERNQPGGRCMSS